MENEKTNELWNYLSDNHDLILIEQEIHEIEDIVKRSLLILVDKDNLPIKKVIAYSGNYFEFGSLYLDKEEVWCLGLQGITHYMEIPQINK